MSYLIPVLGRAFALGMEILGSGRKIDEKYIKETAELLKLADNEKNLTKRERQHVDAVEKLSQRFGKNIHK
jgi:hypothetical protein